MQFRLKVASIVCFGVVFLCLLFQGVTRLIGFVHIFGQHAGIAITQDEVLDLHTANTPDTRTQHIPKIIHQIFHNWHDPGNSTLPSDWQDVRQTCIGHNPDWEHRLWLEAESRAFIEKEYPWFLDTYDNYRFPVQRVDAMKYFILRYYGGVYLDLDNGCNAPLEPVLYFPTWTTDGGLGALSNNIFGAAPNHPFWVYMTEALIPSSWNYPFPYMTIHYSSGQWYETVIWEKYHQALAQNGTQTLEDGQLHRFMMDMRPGSARWVFFSQERGGTWNNWDNYFFLWIGDHLFIVVPGAILLGVGAVWGSMWVWRRMTRRRGYLLLDGMKGENLD